MEERGGESIDPQKLISLKGRKEEERRGDSKGLCVYDHKWREQTPAVTCLCQPYSQLVRECVLCCAVLWCALVCVCRCVISVRLVSITGQTLTPCNQAGRRATEKGV